MAGGLIHGDGTRRAHPAFDLTILSPSDSIKRMMVAFHDEETRKVFAGEFSKKLPSHIQAVARRKLRMLNNARHLDDLRIPPNNRLEALQGDRKGQWSIRVNLQWRVCFLWDVGHVRRVEICDYH